MMELKNILYLERAHFRHNLVNINTAFKTSVDSQNRNIMNFSTVEHRFLASTKWILDILDNNHFRNNH